MAIQTHDDKDRLEVRDATGGYATQARTCRYDNTPLKADDTQWAVIGVNDTPQPSGIVGSVAKQYASTNRGYGLTLWVCSRCGYVEFSDPG